MKLLAYFSVCFLTLSQVVSAEFRAGATMANITPELGGRIVGSFEPVIATHIHDELFARCIVLDDGKTQIALVVCDLIGVGGWITREARANIEKQTGIPATNVLICGTHTHSGTNPHGENRYDMYAPLDDYQKFIAKRIADGVQTAKNNLRPAEFAFGTVDIPEHVFNRRWYLKPGTMPVNPFGKTDDKVKMNPRVGSPDLLEPAGPTDPTVSILSFRGTDGSPIAVLASYSLHYVGGVPTGHISSDYFGVFSVKLRELIGDPEQDPPFVAILANGTSGDVNNVDFKNPRPGKGPYQQMRYVAGDVAQKVAETLKGMVYDRDISLAAVFREPVIGFRHPDEELLSWVDKTLEAGPKSHNDVSYYFAERLRFIATTPEKAPVPLQVLRIGKLCIGTMPCEVFCEIGLEFKKKCPIQPAFLMSIANDYLGYLPPPRQVDLGGYEAWPLVNRLEREASDKFLAELFEMAKEVQVTTSAEK